MQNLKEPIGVTANTLASRQIIDEAVCEMEEILSRNNIDAVCYHAQGPTSSLLHTTAAVDSDLRKYTYKQIQRAVDRVDLRRKIAKGIVKKEMMTKPTRWLSAVRIASTATQGWLMLSQP